MFSEKEANEQGQRLTHPWSGEGPGQKLRPVRQKTRRHTSASAPYLHRHPSALCASENKCGCLPSGPQRTLDSTAGAEGMHVSPHPRQHRMLAFFFTFANMIQGKGCPVVQVGKDSVTSAINSLSTQKTNGVCLLLQCARVFALFPSGVKLIHSSTARLNPPLAWNSGRLFSVCVSGTCAPTQRRHLINSRRAKQSTGWRK